MLLEMLDVFGLCVAAVLPVAATSSCFLVSLIFNPPHLARDANPYEVLLVVCHPYHSLNRNGSDSVLTNLQTERLKKHGSCPDRSKRFWSFP